MKDKDIVKLMIGYVVIIIAASLVKSSFWLDVIVLTGMWAFAAQSWNIAGGYSGQFSLGHCGFMGVGAYTSSILFLKLGLTPWIGMLIGALFCATIGGAYAALCNKLKGHFFGLATLAFGQILYVCATQLRGVTNGSMGVNIPYRPGLYNMIFASRTTYAYIIFTMLLILTIFVCLMQKSKYGYFLYAIRDNERAAISLGVRSKKLKIASFAISAFFASMAGSFYAQYILFIDPDSLMVLSLGVQIAIIAIIGGTGNYMGPILGAAILLPMSMMLKAKVTVVSGLDNLVYGLLLIIIVLFLPDGLLPFIKRQLKRIKGGNNRNKRGELSSDVKV